MVLGSAVSPLSLPAQGYEITLDEVEEEDNKVSLVSPHSESLHASELHASMCAIAIGRNTHYLRFLMMSLCLACTQPKAAVEFDQAINYVNKIKVCPLRNTRHRPMSRSDRAAAQLGPRPAESTQQANS